MNDFSPHNVTIFIISQKRDVTFSTVSKPIVYMTIYMLGFYKENR